MRKDNNLQRIGKIIKKYRLIAGLSQETLSELVECDKNTIGRIERGETDFKISILFRLAESLEVSFTRFAKDFDTHSDEAYASALEYDYLRLFHYCHKLSPEQFNNLCNTAYIYSKSNES